MADQSIDVFVSYGEPAGENVARSLEAALTLRGFRVYASGAASEGDLRLVDEAPDFVAILTPGAVIAYQNANTALGSQLDHAVWAERNIIPLYMPGSVPPTGSTPAAAALSTYQAVTYAPHAGDESLARVAHRLTSTATREERHLSRQAKWMFGAAGFVLAAVALSFALRLIPRTTHVPPLPPLTAAVAVFGQHAASGQPAGLPVQDGAMVAPGDEVRLVFTLNGDAYAYVLAQDAQGDVSVLFPERSVKGGSRVRSGEMREAPTGGRSFSVPDRVGPLTLYLIASYDSIENLESLVEEREGETSPQERQGMLQSTIAGLLDGRHAIIGGTARTRRGQAILQSLDAASPKLPASATATLSAGVVLTRPLTTSTGLLSVMSEIRLHVVR
jgi:hypothetical protein